MSRSSRQFLVISLALLVAGATGLCAQQRGGGGSRGGGGGAPRASAQSSVNRGGSGNNNRGGGGDKGGGGHNNVNIDNSHNTNVNVNVDRDVHVHGGYGGSYYGGCCYNSGPSVVGVVAATIITAAVIGSIVNTLPPSCTLVVVNGLTYQQCGSSWYQPQFVGGSTSYVVIAAPR